jgi:hypothetical protein
MYLFLLSYTLIGAGIKYVDAAFDDETFNKKLAIIIAPIIAMVIVYAMFVNSVSATILLAVVIGVLFTGKIDNIAHILGVVVIFPFIYLLGIEFLFIPLGILVLGGIIDELGNDFIDKRKDKFTMGPVYQKFLMYFFEHRWTLKIVILGFILLGLFPWYFFFAMFLFDYAYLSVSLFSDIKQGVRNPLDIRKAISSIGLIFR